MPHYIPADSSRLNLSMEIIHTTFSNGLLITTLITRRTNIWYHQTNTILQAQEKYYQKYMIDQTWLGVRCHPEGKFKPLLFLHSWTTQGQESTRWSGNCRCFTDIWSKTIWSNFVKSSMLHIFDCWVVKIMWSYINIIINNINLLTQGFTWR